MNRCDQFLGVRSRIKDLDAISSHEEEKASILIVRWIFYPAVVMSREVHRSKVISTVITQVIDGPDEFT